MGKAVITFEDDGDEVKCTFEFDPPIDLVNEVATEAQMLAIEKIARLQEMADEELAVRVNGQ